MSSTATADPSMGSVCDLAMVERVAQSWCATVDPAVLDGADGAERLAVVIRRYQAVQLLLARRAQAANAYAARAHSGPDWFATLNGISKAEAARALATAQRLDGCPATNAAFTAGEISTDEAAAVSDAAQTDPRSEQRLLDGAKAAFMKLRLEQARRDNTRESWDAYRADAYLAAIAAAHPTTTTDAAPPAPQPTPDPAESQADGRLFTPDGDLSQADGLDPKINWNLVILVDGIALKRGFAAPGETCEIPGISTIPIAWIQQLLPDIHTEMLIHDSVDIRAYATTTRHRTRPVDLAVRVRDRTCTVPRCHHDPSELDHTTDYAHTHDTSTANLHAMCNHHHDDKTYRHATFQRHHTHWHWWPPDTDPTTNPPLTAPTGTHLTAWNLDHPPGSPAPDGPGPAEHPPAHPPDRPDGGPDPGVGS